MNEIHNSSMASILETQNEKLHYGKVISVRGSVIDVRFENNLPPVYTLLHSGKKKKYQ
ncbi:hypothetical protein BH20BAC1_BH20BAC1_10760 [soil metagenome]